VIAVVQPHRYTRLQSLFEPFSTCFNDADAVIVADVYSAGEAPIEGADRDNLWCRDPRARPPQRVCAAKPAAALAGIVKGIAKPGDYVVCLGAGNITQWAYALIRNPVELSSAHSRARGKPAWLRRMD
jgi:UDP-N-acetylmuramate--alanine ligase